MSDTVVMSAFTEEQAERLTGVTRRQLRYWATDILAPSITIDSPELADLRLYSFTDLACLKVLNALRNDAKVPLQEIRRTKTRLQTLGERAWTTTTLYVLGKRVVFDNPETGEREEVASGQGVLQIPLRVVIGRLQDSINDTRRRRDDQIGQIARQRHVAQNQAVISGTRVPVRSIRAFAEAGYSVGDIIRQYPSLRRGDIVAAIAYDEAV